MTRFHRTELLLGKAGLEALREARILVAGLGAVGSFAAEGLARAGAGHLRLVDFDEIRESNINRQLHALTSTLGQPKVTVMKVRILEINPVCDVETERVFVDSVNAGALLENAPLVLIDAIDSFTPKTALLAAAVHRGVPLIVSCMGAARRTDPSAIRVGDIMESENCPLARRIRKRLRRSGIQGGIRCVYSNEPALPGEGELPPDEQETHPRGRVRRPLGSLACITGIFGLIAAREAIMFIAGKADDRA